MSPCGMRFRLPLLTSSTRIAKFVTVGITGTIIYCALLWSMVELLRVPVLFATSVAFVFVVLQNYALHYRWTFRSDSEHTTVFPRFVFMCVVGFAMNWSIMFAGVQRLHLNYLLVQAVAIAAVVIWNFLLSSMWIFRSSTSNKAKLNG